MHGMKRETQHEDEELNHTEINTEIKTYIAMAVIGLRRGKSEGLDLVVVVNDIVRIACCLCKRTKTKKKKSKSGES